MADDQTGRMPLSSAGDLDSVRKVGRHRLERTSSRRRMKACCGAGNPKPRGLRATLAPTVRARLGERSGGKAGLAVPLARIEGADASQSCLNSGVTTGGATGTTTSRLAWSCRVVPGCFSGGCCGGCRLGGHSMARERLCRAKTVGCCAISADRRFPERLQGCTHLRRSTARPPRPGKPNTGAKPEKAKIASLGCAMF